MTKEELKEKIQLYIAEYSFWKLKGKHDEADLYLELIISHTYQLFSEAQAMR